MWFRKHTLVPDLQYNYFFKKILQLLPLGTGQEDKELLMLASHVTPLAEAFPGQHKAIPGRTRAVKPLQKARCQAGFVFLSCQDFLSPIETIYL